MYGAQVAGANWPLARCTNCLVEFSRARQSRLVLRDHLALSILVNCTTQIANRSLCFPGTRTRGIYSESAQTDRRTDRADAKSVAVGHNSTVDIVLYLFALVLAQTLGHCRGLDKSPQQISKSLCMHTTGISNSHHASFVLVNVVGAASIKYLKVLFNYKSARLKSGAR